MVKKFLIEKEHGGDVLKLFTGAVERVGALVARVEGMLEFEVQPLREYFTGRFLYETAPYSPPGAEKGGTRPQRFDALARRPYWLNVARFYAGCYNSGELSSLVSGLEQLSEGSDLALNSHSLQLAVLFLNDWVFAQEPKTVRDVVSFLCSKTNLRLLVASRTSWEEEDRLALPEKCGRKEFAAKVKSVFILTTEAAYLGRLGSLLKSNMDFAGRWSIWQELRSCGQHAFFQALYLGLFIESNEQQTQELIGIYENEARHAFISCGRWDLLKAEDRHLAVSDLARQTPSQYIFQLHGDICREDIDLYRVYVMLHPDLYSIFGYQRDTGSTLERAMVRFNVFPPTKIQEVSVESSQVGVFDVVASASRASRATIRQWQKSLEPCSDFLESVRRTWGDGTAAYCLAAIGAGIVSKDIRSASFNELHNDQLPLVERARYARLSTASVWWKKAIHDAVTAEDKFWVLMLLFSWSASSVIRRLHPLLAKILNDLDTERWATLLAAVEVVVRATSTGRQPLSGQDVSKIADVASPRVKALLTLRLPRSLSVPTLVGLLNGYDGVDLPLGKFLATRGISQAYRDPKIWKDLIDFFSSYGLGPVRSDIDHVLGPRVFFYGRGQGMSAIVAREVASNPEIWPLEILGLAEMRLSRQSGSVTNTLGRISVDQKWFAQ